MRKLLLLTFSVSLFASCSHDFGNYGTYVDVDALKDKNPNEVTQEDIQANVASIFGTIDPNQDWSLINSSEIKINADADLYDIQKVQILTESPFMNSEARVLSEAEVQKGQTVTLSYEAPSANVRLIAACVDSKGHYYIKSFAVGATELSFQSSNARARSLTRAASSSYPTANKLKVEYTNSTPSYNAMRTWVANMAAVSGDNDFKSWAKTNYIDLWKGSKWEAERLWMPTNSGLDNGWKIENNTVLREISNISDEEKSTLEDIFNKELYREADGKGWAARRNNLPLIREGDIVKFYNNHLTSDGSTPITIIPVQTASSEMCNCHLYYYYYKPAAIPSGMTEDEYIKRLPKFKAIQMWHTMTAAGITNSGSNAFFKKHEYLLPYYGDPNTFSDQYTTSEGQFTTDGKLYRIRNKQQNNNTDYYMTFLPMNQDDKLAIKYDDNAANVKDQLWQIFTDADGNVALYNISAKQFLVWDGGWATKYSAELSVVKSNLYKIAEDNESQYKYIWRFNNVNNKGLGTDIPSNYGVWTDKKLNGDKFCWKFEEYTGSKAKAENSIVFENHQSTAIAPSIAIPAGYQIGFVLRKLKGSQNWKNDAILTSNANGCCYSSGSLNKEINHFPGHFGSSMTQYQMEEDDPRVAYFTANGKTYLAFEDGCDAQFSDLIIEVGGYDPTIVTAAPVGTEDKSSGIETSSIACVKDIPGLPYMMCFEDSPIADYDMNDVVLRIERLNAIQIKVSLEACGAYDELYLKGLNGSRLNEQTEIHAMFGVGQQTFINTVDEETVHPAIEEVFTVDPLTRLSDFISNIYVYDKTQNRSITLAGLGEDPHAIIVPGSFDYPKEKACITSAYPLFKNWVQKAEDDRFWFQTAQEEFIYKKE